MNRSLGLVLVAAAAALGLAACTSAPASENVSASTTTSAVTTTTSSSPTVAPPDQVVTQVMTETVTKEPAPPAKPVIGSFGYGNLKIGMPYQAALDSGMLGPNLDSLNANAQCTLHEIIGTGGKVYVSKAKGVATIYFTPGMSSDGVGAGVTLQKLESEYTNLRKSAYAGYLADADNNPNAYFQFVLDAEGKVDTAALNIRYQDCHS